MPKPQQTELFDHLPESRKPEPPQQRLPGLGGGSLGGAPGPVPGEEGDPADQWYRRLRSAFERPEPPEGYLQLAETALEACPSDPDVLMLGASAALIDGKGERALVLLKRFSKRYDSSCVPLLTALGLDLIGRRPAARLLLEKHRIDDLLAAYNRFPPGRSQLDWLQRHFSRIVVPERPTPGGASSKGRGAGPAGKGGRAEARRATEARPAEPVPAAEPPPPPPLPLPAIDIPLSITIDLAPMAEAMGSSPVSDSRDFALRERLAHLALAQGFDELLCLPHLSGVEPLWHQTETVRKVLKQFRGRVLLADEVGLGKTIEAGMVLKEYALRGMAERVLVLTPASLVGQWREELETKFGLASATTYDALVRDDPALFWDQPRIIASIATARRREHMEELAKRQFDIVVVDEAHHLRDRDSAGWKLVDALNKRFLLLLSATPVQNDLVELYNLLTLLKPGIFKTLKDFRAQYMTPGKPRQPANPDSLRQLMRGAMIRNTRAAVAVKLPRRHASTIKAEPVAGEAEAYRLLGTAARDLAAASGGAGRQRLVLHHLLGAAGSSPAAAARACRRIGEQRPSDRAWQELATRFAAIPSGGKETALIELLQRNPAEKKLVFVQARETLEHLGQRLATAGIAFARFDGGMSGPEKDAAIAEFRDSASTVLLTTQSGGEGRNIQFCNTLINFDVPWNPMAIEQRIGRIDRIGQAREVFVFNLVTRGTIEEQVLGLLEEKISMFELVVGEVGAILGTVEEERDFPDLVLEAWLEASEEGRDAAFAALGDRLDEARRQHEGAKELDERLFGQDFETG